MAYSYQTCIEAGSVPPEPLLTATGEELNTLVALLPDHWDYWDKEKKVSCVPIAEVKFEPDEEYDLRETGTFEWEGCVWDEPLLFAYNKWKHCGLAWF